MGAFFTQLGIDWKLLLSQAVNFFLVLLILRLFVYKPLLRMLKERKRRIQEGLQKAEEADTRLKEIDAIGVSRIKKAEEQGAKLLKETEQRGKRVEADLLAAAEQKEKEALDRTEHMIAAKKAASDKVLEQEAAHLVKATLAETVALAPDQIDERLIQQAIEKVRKTHRP